MVSKKELLKNIQSYSPEEIADAIRAGIVTLYELGHDTEGQFTPLLKKQVKDILARPVTPHVVSVSTSQNTTEETTNKQSVMNAAEEPSFEENGEVNTPFVMPSQEQESNNDNKETNTIYTENKSKPGMFRNPFSFKGRIRRLEYGISFIIMVIVNTIMQGILSMWLEVQMVPKA